MVYQLTESATGLEALSRGQGSLCGRLLSCTACPFDLRRQCTSVPASLAMLLTGRLNRVRRGRLVEVGLVGRGGSAITMASSPANVCGPARVSIIVLFLSTNLAILNQLSTNPLKNRGLGVDLAARIFGVTSFPQ